MDIRREDGLALVVAMLVMMLLSALGIALVLTTSSETIISASFRNAGEAVYAADAVVERAIDDLLTVPDWNRLLNGLLQSTFTDGPPSGQRTRADGSTLDLAQAINMANCQQTTTCSDGEMNAVTAERPWGSNNPRWQLYAYGSLRDMLPADTIDSQYYVILMIGDDPSETDNDPLRDGNSSETSPGTGVLEMRAEAFGPRGAHKVVEVTVARTATTEPERRDLAQSDQDVVNDPHRDSDNSVGQEAGVRILSWREVR